MQIHRANKIIMLNYCDGFGWVSRQMIYQIYDASDFVFNQKEILMYLMKF
jgi:hypothetical protein